MLRDQFHGYQREIRTIKVATTARGSQPDKLAKVFEAVLYHKRTGRDGLGMSMHYVLKQSGCVIFCGQHRGLGTCFTLLLSVLVQALQKKKFRKTAAPPHLCAVRQCGVIFTCEDEAPYVLSSGVAVARVLLSLKRKCRSALAYF